MFFVLQSPELQRPSTAPAGGSAAKAAAAATSASSIFEFEQRKLLRRQQLSQMLNQSLQAPPGAAMTASAEMVDGLTGALLRDPPFT